MSGLKNNAVVIYWEIDKILVKREVGFFFSVTGISLVGTAASNCQLLKPETLDEVPKTPLLFRVKPKILKRFNIRSFDYSAFHVTLVKYTQMQQWFPKMRDFPQNQKHAEALYVLQAEIFTTYLLKETF